MSFCHCARVVSLADYLGVCHATPLVSLYRSSLSGASRLRMSEAGDRDSIVSNDEGRRKGASRCLYVVGSGAFFYVKRAFRLRCNNLTFVSDRRPLGLAFIVALRLIEGTFSFANRPAGHIRVRKVGTSVLRRRQCEDRPFLIPSLSTLQTLLSGFPYRMSARIPYLKLPLTTRLMRLPVLSCCTATKMWGLHSYTQKFPAKPFRHNATSGRIVMSSDEFK